MLVSVRPEEPVGLSQACTITHIATYSPPPPTPHFLLRVKHHPCTATHRPCEPLPPPPLSLPRATPGVHQEHHNTLFSDKPKQLVGRPCCNTTHLPTYRKLPIVIWGEMAEPFPLMRDSTIHTHMHCLPATQPLHVLMNPPLTARFHQTRHNNVLVSGKPEELSASGPAAACQALPSHTAVLCALHP